MALIDTYDPRPSPFAAWFAARVTKTADVLTREVELFADVEAWCSRFGRKPWALSSFRRGLIDSGLRRIWSSGEPWWTCETGTLSPSLPHAAQPAGGPSPAAHVAGCL